MKKIPLIKIFNSNYCKIVFILSLILVTLLIPKKVFYGYYKILAVSFILLTSLMITCFVRNIKEKIYSAKLNGVSFIGIIGIVFGVGALQACTIGAPVCGASIGAGVFALIFPGFAFGFIENYSIHIIIASIIIQITALYFMGCINEKSKRRLK